MKKLLKLEELKVGVGNRLLVRIPKLEVDEGRTVLITGPSGSGKTTLLRCILRICDIYDVKFSGTIHLDVPLKEISYIPQEPWFGILSPYPYMELKIFTSANDSIVNDLAKSLGVYRVLNSNSIDLSAGEIQRLLFIEAILNRSRLIMMDEVTAYLDDEAKHALVYIVDKVKRELNTTFIVVDHNLELWRNYVDLVLYINPFTRDIEIYEDVEDVPLYEKAQLINRELSGLLKDVHIMRKDLVVRVENLWFKYPDSKDYILRGVNLAVHRGEILVLQGASGKGKSTLLKIITGVYKPSRGKVLRMYRSAQYIPENPLLYLSEPTVRDELMNNVVYAQKVSLVHVLDVSVMKLSSGERRRLALASAILRRPDVIVVDEPSVGLDPENFLRVAELLAEALVQGIAVIIATHSRELAAMSRNVVLL